MPERVSGNEYLDLAIAKEMDRDVSSLVGRVLWNEHLLGNLVFLARIGVRLGVDLCSKSGLPLLRNGNTADHPAAATACIEKSATSLASSLDLDIKIGNAICHMIVAHQVQRHAGAGCVLVNTGGKRSGQQKAYRNASGVEHTLVLLHGAHRFVCAVMG